ncbi:MAG: beta-1,3-glucanase family protein [Isosphaeraceae bacterium]|nr:beta-1,3-glucanase family protein [Isosphaeraceae bacterium]
MLRIRDAGQSPFPTARPKDRRRPHTPRVEALETRALLTTTVLNSSALITLGGSIDRPHAVDVVPIDLTRDRLTPATATQRTLLDIDVTPTAGSALVPGVYRLVDSSGRSAPVALSRSGNALKGLANLKPGDYALQVRGRGASTGSFVVQASLAGDANGNGSVDQTDLALIRAALGTRTNGRVNLDPNQNGRIDRNDLSLARRNLGATSNTITIQVANLTGTGSGDSTNPQFPNSQIYVSIYGEVPANDSTTNPSGWSYFDATGTAHSLDGANGPLTTVPYFTLDQAPNGIAIPNSSVIVSGEVYVGFGSPVTLPVDVGVSGLTVTSGGSGYTSAPTVSLSGGTAATAALGQGTVTATLITNPGSGYATAPAVTISGGGGTGATATATIADGQVTGITITNPGSGYTNAPSLSFSSGNATAVAVITGGVASVNVSSPGSGYTTAPTVTISGGGGTGATATAVLTNGAVSSVTVNNAGSGYTSAPSVYFSGGSNATATATIAGGAVTALTVGNNGTGYTTVPSVTISGGGGTGATATAQTMISGVAAPSPSNPTDPNQSDYWEFAEFTMNSPAAPSPYINADLSQVDIASYPMTLQLTSSTQGNSAVVGVYPARSDLFQNYQSFVTAQNQPLFQSLVTNTGVGNDGPFRILAPSDYVLLNPSDPLSTYYNNYAGQVFNPGNTLTIQVDDPGNPTAATGTATLNGSGGVASVNVTNAGAGYTFPPVVSLLGGNGTGATATATINAAGVVTGVTITNPGSGYTTAPNVAFSSGAGTFSGTVVDQIAATGTATLSGDGVGAVQVTSAGADYATPPNVTISGGGGTGATATAQINGVGQVTGVTVTNAGAGYTSAPTVTFSAATSTATGTATLTGNGVGAVQVTTGGSGYTTPPAVTLSGGGGTGATATATINGTGQVTGVTIVNAGTGYTTAPTVTFSPAAIAYQFTGQSGTQQGMQYNVFSPLTPPSWIQPIGTSQPSWRATWMVFGNAGVFADNLDQFPNAGSASSKILGNIENQIVSAMSRGVALLPYSSWSDSTKFYAPGATANWYAAYLHQATVTVGGLAYGFPFDDQGGNSTDISVSNPTTMVINIGWKAALPTS